MSSWMPHLVQVMWEVFQDLRCDKAQEVQQQGKEIQIAKVPLPSLDKEHCRWFKCHGFYL